MRKNNQTVSHLYYTIALNKKGLQGLFSTGIFKNHSTGIISFQKVNKQVGMR